MHQMSVDIETYSDVDLKSAGLYKYAQSEAFDILLIAWALDDGAVQVIDMTKRSPLEDSPDDQGLYDFMAALKAKDVLVRAYNAAFEWYCLTEWASRNGWTLPRNELLGRMRCTMAHGLYCGYTAGLAAMGEALGLPPDKRKASVGYALIRLFCVPQKAARTRAAGRLFPSAEPEKWQLFKEYCRQDVATEREIERRLARWPMPEREQRLWALTAWQNAMGVQVDKGLVDGALQMGADENAALLNEAKRLSGLDNPKSVAQLLKWLQEELPGEEISDLKKDTVAGLIKSGAPGDRAARMLELRQLLSKTSTKKYDAIEAALCADGRVRGLMEYYGANRTGRWAGRLIQPQNLPRNYLAPLDFAREFVKSGDMELLKLWFSSVPDTLSQLIRTAFTAYPGKTLCVADYSAIEARVIAWLAGEEWVLEVFRTTGKIYEATASQMFKVPMERIVKGNEEYALRQRGKVATLALGYGGGEGALVRMGALEMGLKEDELPDIKARWRETNPNIVRLWGETERAALAAVNAGRGETHGLIFAREFDEETAQDFLSVTLPAGRKLFYAHPFLAPAKNMPDRTSLHYFGVDQQTRRFVATDTWGGKLVENIVQAIARDCLAETLLKIAARGIGDTMFHVHDEVIVSCDRPDGLDEILNVMKEPIAWAPGLPLKGAGFTGEYYQKD